MGIAALILGIVSLIMALVPLCGVIAIVPAFVGIVLGIVDLVSKVRKNSRVPAIVGIVLSFIAFVVIVFWVVFFVILGAEGRYGKHTTNEINSIVQEIIDENQREEEKTFYINEEAQVKDMSITVTKVEKTKGNDSVKPQEGHEFVVVNVTMTNKGESNCYYNADHFTMQNSQGQIKEIEDVKLDRITDIGNGYLVPGGSVSGSIIFEQPIDDNSLVLLYTPNFDMNPELKILL